MYCLAHLAHAVRYLVGSITGMKVGVRGVAVGFGALVSSSLSAAGIRVHNNAYD